MKPDETVAKFATVQSEGSKQVARDIEFYNLDVILIYAGTISHEQALRKAGLEFEKLRVLQLVQPSQVEKDFEEAVKQLSKLRKSREGD